jgi:ketosteroid isomerase-like protein
VDALLSLLPDRPALDILKRDFMVRMDTVRAIVRHAAAALPLLFIAGVACDGRSAAPPPAETAAAAEAAVASFFEAMNSGDPDRVLAHFHPGEELVQVACTDVRRGYDRIAALIRTWYADRPEVQLQLQVIRSAALGRDGAVVAAQGWNERGEPLFWTYVLRRDTDGNWLIVQEHQSWAGCREPRIRQGPA